MNSSDGKENSNPNHHNCDQYLALVEDLSRQSGPGVITESEDDGGECDVDELDEHACLDKVSLKNIDMKVKLDLETGHRRNQSTYVAALANPENPIHQPQARTAVNTNIQRKPPQGPSMIARPACNRKDSHTKSID